ncbi:A/G-specific adenine glycosylase [Patescibacteria group bacterium]|nr:A/G-specific adenine glycosylase [Patescibacteria group bacterium]
MVLAKRYVARRKAILCWYAVHQRDLPWRRTNDPYAILVSEMMLQQTQVDRVIPKFVGWLEVFPTVEALAHATPAAVLRAWSGLGYNRRALFLQRAARCVAEAGWPQTVDGMSTLPGIGPYTAGAVLSFAFGKRTLAFDVNVQRVVRRAFVGVSPKKKRSEGKALLALAEKLLPKDASTWQQGLMDLGATICTTRPHCLVCPLRATCPSAKAFLAGWKEPSVKKQTVRFVDSARFVRGQILKQLAAHERRSVAQLEAVLGRVDVSAERFALALRALEREGLIERKNRVYALPGA